jgi:hypothetical protein
MVIKPAASDTALLAVFAVIAALGAQVTLVKGMRSKGVPA